MILVNVPVENGLGKTRGCKDAPCRIMQSLFKLGGKYKTEEWDLNGKNLEETQTILFKEAIKLFEKNKDNNEKIIFFGGDHSISFPLIKAFRSVYPISFLFVLDAHVDLMKPMKEPTHEEWLRALIESGFDSRDLIIMGTRKIYNEEKDFLEKNKIKIIKKEEIFEFFSGNEFESLKEYDAVYLSLDVDVLDKKLMGATGYPEGGGLVLNELKESLHKIFELKNLKAVDIVEMNPEKDLNNKALNLVIESIEEIFKKN
jgi:agmatinase